MYLRLRSPAASSNLPPDIGRATLNCRYTRSCNPQGVLPTNIAAAAVGSYPTFSPLPADRSRHRRLFSVTLLHPHERRAINSCGALRCSDFPLPSRAAIERTCNFLLYKPATLADDGRHNIVRLTAYQRFSPNHGSTACPKRVLPRTLCGKPLINELLLITVIPPARSYFTTGLMSLILSCVVTVPR